MNHLVTTYLSTGSKSTHLTNLIYSMDRTQAVNLIDSLAAEKHWFEKKCDFMKIRSNHYRARLCQLLRRVEKMLKREIFPYEVLNGHYVQRHFVLCYKQFERLFVSGSNYEWLHGNDTLNVVYVDYDAMKILYYVEGDVNVMTAMNAEHFQNQLERTEEDFR
nr:hypothetical protein [Vibrio sp. 04Ya108]